MLTIFIRTIFIYILLVATMRLMGKRQLGEIELSELVITFLLSEIATLPITNNEIPLLFAIIPMATLISLEIIMSILLLKVPVFKKILSSRPSILIYKGKIDQKQLTSVRISIDELLTQVRQNGIYNLEEVDYAILEENGKMTIIPKNENRPPDKKCLGIFAPSSGVMHVLISDGKINSFSLNLFDKDISWLVSILEQKNIRVKDVFCMTCDDTFHLYIQKKDGTIYRN